MALLDLNPVLKTDEERLHFIDEVTKDVGSVQDRVLAEILSKNADTEYLQRHGLGGATDSTTFKAKIPVVTYDDLRPDIERIANGDRSKILSSEPISRLHTSSATSGGKRKLIPSIRDDQNRQRLFIDLANTLTKQYFPGIDEGKRLEMFILSPITESPGGIPMGPAITSAIENSVSHYLSGHSCPGPCVVLCRDYFQSMYIQMIAGLYQRLQILLIGAPLAYTLIHSIDFLRQNWPQLVHDITTGTLTDKITDQNLRDSVSDLLKSSNPELGNFIARQCSNSEDWSGIITKIWPNAKCLRTAVTGSMSQYIPMLDYYSGGLPIASMAYACSESQLGVNLQPLRDPSVCNPSEVSYTLLPNMAYIEFILQKPTDGDDQPDIFNLTNVELGNMYELVVTTFAGLYRYRVGDIFQMTGYHNTAPKFKFVARKGALLSVGLEKITEAELQKAVEDASGLLRSDGMIVEDYTSYTDAETMPGHYVIFLELMVLNGEVGEALTSLDGGAKKVLERCCLEMEDGFNEMYKNFRMNGKVGPLEIRVVRDGTFAELMDSAVSRGTSIAQYKVPRCIRAPYILDMLHCRVVSSYFSLASPPHWEPYKSIW